MSLIPGDICERLLTPNADYAIPADALGGAWAAFFDAEACRRCGHFDSAARIIDRIAELGDHAHLDAIERHRCRIFAADQSPIEDELVAHHPPAVTFAQNKQANKRPNAGQLVFNFSMALARWAAAGFPTRTDSEIQKRLAICRACDWFENDHCGKCGCACIEANQLLNKLAIASEKCPLNKWD